MLNKLLSASVHKATPINQEGTVVSGLLAAHSKAETEEDLIGLVMIARNNWNCLDTSRENRANLRDLESRLRTLPSVQSLTSVDFL